MPLDRYRNSALVEGVDLHALPLAEGAAAANQDAASPDAQSEPKVWLRRHLVEGATGSAYMEFGSTKVLCSVHGPMEPKRSAMTDSAAAEQAGAQLQVYFKLAPFARPGRVPYQPDESERRAAAFLQDSLAPSLRLDRLPRSRLELHCLVLESAGCCLATAATCAGLALADAGLEMYDLVTAATVARPVGAGSGWSPERGQGGSSVTLAYMRNLRQLAGIWVDGAEPLDPGEVVAACRMCVEPCKLMHATVRQFLLEGAGLSPALAAASACYGGKLGSDMSF